MPKIKPPRIGQPWPEQGGIYAGIMAGRDGHPDCHLIVATAEQGEIVDVEWGGYGTRIAGADSYFDGRTNTAAMVAANLDLGKRITALQIEGHADYHLPSQAEMHLLAANLKDQFDQDDWYWTSTQGSANYAWDQYFGYGSQSYDYKSYEARARAVRLIQLSVWPFNPLISREKTMLKAITIPIDFELTPRSRAVMDALYKSLSQRFVDPSGSATSTPAIGEIWPEQGGIYAGVSRGEDGAPDAHLVLLDAVPEKDLNWAEAIKWADGLGNGARLPTRFESAMLYANLRDKLDTERWYWTGTQYSAHNAWNQNVDYGSQINYFKSCEARARAVRRFIL